MSADIRLELAKATAEVAALTAERDRLRERRIEAIRDLAEGKTVIGAIWHALGIPADADADIVAEVRALVARDKPGCSLAHQELATVEAERDTLAAQLARAETVVNPPIGQVCWRVEAWPHDPGANGEHYSSGRLPAADVASELRDLATRIEADWADPECPWPDEHQATPATTEVSHDQS